MSGTYSKRGVMVNEALFTVTRRATRAREIQQLPRSVAENLTPSRPGRRSFLMSEGHISTPMTWGEICERYPNKWVALVEIDWVNETDFDFRSARVIGHGTRREQYEQARQWSSRYASMGHFFTGRVRAPATPLFFP